MYNIFKYLSCVKIAYNNNDTEEWSKGKLILEKYAFWRDAIDLKQLVEGILKVLGKSLQLSSMMFI